MKAVSNQTTRQGVYYALSAYLFWGLVPIYFKLIDHISPWEILAQRVIWALILLIGILAYTGELNALKVSRRQLPTLVLTSGLLSINWLVFIYAIVNHNIVETSLGYFINPLVSVFLAVVFLRENLRPIQWVAIAIAGTGILVQLIFYGSIPWLALILAFSFGFYGLFRKNLGMHPIAGLAIETIIIAPFGIAYLIWALMNQHLEFGQDTSTDLLLILSGFVTSFPLLCFAAAVTRLSLTSIGMFQYIAPSLSLIIAVFMYNETVDPGRSVSFGCIWLALIIFTADAWYFHRRRQLVGDSKAGP